MKNKNPTPPKLRFVFPPEERGGVGGGVLGTFGNCTITIDILALNPTKAIWVFLKGVQSNDRYSSS
jgi:hypothetical protein